jgi:hypothetical protein
MSAPLSGAIRPLPPYTFTKLLHGQFYLHRQVPGVELASVLLEYLGAAALMSPLYKLTMADDF